MLDYKGFLYLYIINIVKSQYFGFYNYVNFINIFYDKELQIFKFTCFLF